MTRYSREDRDIQSQEGKGRGHLNFSSYQKFVHVAAENLLHYVHNSLLFLVLSMKRIRIKLFNKKSTDGVLDACIKSSPSCPL